MIGEYCDIDDCVDEVEVLGPPDIEKQRRPHRRSHLPGRVHARTRCGRNRFPTRTAMDGVYLCGAATHPAGSVMQPQRPQRRRWPSSPTSTQADQPAMTVAEPATLTSPS